MQVRFAKALYVASTALTLSLAAYSAAQADPYLPGLTNLNFATYTGTTPKGYFTDVKPTGWSKSPGVGTLVFVDSSATFAQSAAGGVYLSTYANPVGVITTGTANYVEADGNPEYESGINYTISGLTVGETYTVSFYQGASQQRGFHGDTTNQWIVALGTSGLFSADSSAPSVEDTHCGTNCVYSDSDGTASIAASPLMTVPSGTAVGWDYVSVNVTADATTDTLSFLAWGDGGNTENLPPIAFLAGIDSPPGLGAAPEPASMTLLGVGLVGLGAVVRRRRAKRSTSN